MPQVATTYTNAPNVIDRAITFGHAQADAEGLTHAVYLRQRTDDWSTTNRGLFHQCDLYFVLPYNKPPPADARLIAHVPPHQPALMIYEHIEP